MDLASSDCHLVAQHDDLDGEIGVTSANESDELEGAAERQVEEREGHCWMLVALGSRRQSAGRGQWMTFSAPTGTGRARSPAWTAGTLASCGRSTAGTSRCSRGRSDAARAPRTPREILGTFALPVTALSRASAHAAAYADATTSMKGQTIVAATWLASDPVALLGVSGLTGRRAAWRSVSGEDKAGPDRVSVGGRGIWDTWCRCHREGAVDQAASSYLWMSPPRTSLRVTFLPSVLLGRGTGGASCRPR